MTNSELEREKWSVTKALQEAAKIGVSLSRPTIIRLCKEKGVGYQPTGSYGSWLVYASEFMKMMYGKGDE